MKQFEDNLFKIKNVERVPGNIINIELRNEMQIIYTDVSDYIDNSPDFGGHDWKNDIGKTIEADIRKINGYYWIKFCKYIEDDLEDSLENNGDYDLQFDCFNQRDFLSRDKIFRTYIDFDKPEMIAIREEIGGKKTFNPTKDFKDYLIEAYLEMDYDLEDISKIYGISIEILKDWIFVYKNKYEPVVPHSYFSVSDDNLRSLLEVGRYNPYKNYGNININSFFISFTYEIPESIRIRFNELFKNKKKKSDDEIAIFLRIYPSLVKELRKDLRNNNKSDYFYKKAINLIPTWAQSPNQYNHRIIRAYFKAYHRFDEPPTKDMIIEICNSDKSCYVDNFQATYSSLKVDGPTTNGKVFIDDGIYVQIWEEVEDVLLKYEHYFYNTKAN